MSVYDKPFRYNKKAGAYVVTIQRPTKSQAGIYEVTLEHGDRAVPHGYVEEFKSQHAYQTYLFRPNLFRPSRANVLPGDRSNAQYVGASASLQEAIEDVRKAWELVALPRG
jgi:hypothetical protein